MDVANLFPIFKPVTAPHEPGAALLLISFVVTVGGYLRLGLNPCHSEADPIIAEGVSSLYELFSQCFPSVLHFGAVLF